MLPHRITPEEYLAMEREAEIKSEYVDGEIFAMAGASRKHNQISANIVRILGNQLLERPCSVYVSDMKVKAEKAENYFYPDIVISCEEEEFEDDEEDILLNPIVIIEILSDSTEAYDRGKKFANYQRIDSFVEYILISHNFCRVEKFMRRDDKTWIYSAFRNMDEVVQIDSAMCELPIAEIYKKMLTFISASVSVDVGPVFERNSNHESRIYFHSEF
ncbi:Uma2 family endonuclease [Desulfobacterales bacterium HSG2]|nr:Uma2 family endonuclease [Desulfobacterales bacterium HSG2]